MTLGLRQGELLALVWSDVDLDRCLLTVSGTITWLNGRPYVGRPKSEPGRRTVSIPAQVAAVLGAWKATQDTEREAAGEAWLDNNLVFAAPEGRPRRGDVQTHRFRLLCESYELPSIRFHDLRRLAAVLLRTSSGGDVMSAGAALGHSANLGLPPTCMVTSRRGSLVAWRTARRPRCGRSIPRSAILRAAHRAAPREAIGRQIGRQGVADCRCRARIEHKRRHSSAVEQLFRKQQVLGSNPSVGSTPPFRAQEALLSRLPGPSGGPICLATTLVAREDLLTGRDGRALNHGQ